MQDLKITLIQSSIHWENITANLQMFSEKIFSIRRKTDLIILPEMFSTGFTMNNQPLAETMQGKTTEWLKKTAKQKNCVITGSIIIREGKKFFNRLFWMPPGGKFTTYDKRHLFRYVNEQNYYRGGKKKIIVKLNGWKICPMVCYDLRFPVWIRNKFVRRKAKIESDYDLLIFVANWPERRNHPWKTLLLARAMENQCYVAGVNRVGDDGNGIAYSGDSAVVNPKGEIISKIKPHEEFIETVSLSYSELLEWRKKFPAWRDADKFKLETGSSN